MGLVAVYSNSDCRDPEKTSYRCVERDWDCPVDNFVMNTRTCAMASKEAVCTEQRARVGRNSTRKCGLQLLLIVVESVSGRSEPSVGPAAH